MTAMRAQARNGFCFCAACVLAAALFLLLYRCDNKYTARAAVGADGVTELDAAFLQTDRPVYLAAGWELYPDLLLTPEELDGYRAVPTHIGQYASLSDFHSDGSPYGTATYRLRLRASGPPAVYTVLLPEPFSACTIYVNGQRVAASGSVSPYEPRVRDTAFPLTVDGTAELVIQTANYTHYYSGLTYPPVLGTAEAIHLHGSLRMLFYGFLCFSALTLALFSAAVWYGTRKLSADRLSLWFGILAVSFSLRVGYPFFRMLGVPSVRPLYALEDATFLLGVWCALRITLAVCRLEDSRAGRSLARVAFHVFLVGALVPLLFPLLPAFVPVYGQFIYWYKLVSALLLAGVALFGGGRAHSGWLLAGVGCYGTGLFAHALTLGRFEPARTGWQDEYGAFCLVLCFAVVMALRTFDMVRENRRLTAHLQEAVEEKTRTLNRVLEDRRQFLAGAAHDLKAPITSLRTFVQMVEDGGVGLDPETQGYLEIIRQKTDEMRDRLVQIQTFAAEDAQPQHMEPLDLGELLRRFYEANLPDMEVVGVRFTLDAPHRPCMILGDRPRLERVLQNIVYNAAGFTPTDGEISLRLTHSGDRAILRIADTGSGIAPEDLPRVFDRFFSHREDGDGTGLGLYIARTIVREHDGEIAAESELGKGAAFEIRLPLL